MLEFPFDSTRAVTNLILSGTLERCPNVRLIVPHGGGTLPFLARRIDTVAGRLLSSRAHSPKGGFIAALQRLFYDTAAATGDNSLASLLTLVDSSRILFGSDYPFMPEALTELMLAELHTSSLLTPDDLRAIGSTNARKLFDRFR
jgi:predicted TIM-barrel fold metal-dependent hydrolase